MTYMAPGAWWDLFEATPAGVVSKPQRAIAKKLLGNDSFFVGKVIQLSVLRNNLAAQWPRSRVDYPTEAAIKITRTVSDALSGLNGQIRRLTERDPRLVVLYNLTNIEMQQYAQALGSCISDANRAGAPTARCPNLRSATLTAFDNIIKHYDTIGTAANELDTDLMLRMEEAFAYVGQVITMVGQGIKDNFPKVPDFGSLAEIIKWGSIGGALIILYWYVLRPADKRQKQQ